MKKHNIKILVVDDQPNNLRFLSDILTQQGYKVQRAISGQLALNAANAAPPDLILLDILMPEMNGYDVCIRLKNSDKTKRIPIIFLSAIHEANDKVKAFKIGGADFIAKPFQVEEVLARIEHQLAIQNLQKQLHQQNQSLQREIQARQRTELELRATKERLQYLLSSNPSVIYSCEVSQPYTKTFISENIATIFGYQSQEFLGDRDFWIKHIHPEDRTGVLTEVSQILEVGHHTYKYRFLHQDGSYRWVLDMFKVVRDERGNPIEIVGSISDITEHKQIENALQHSEARLQKLAANIPGMLYEFLRHPDGLFEFIYVSSGCREINELEPQQLLENAALGFEIVHPDDAQRLITSINNSIQTLEPWVWEGRIITPSGKLKWTQGAARPEQQESGAILWHGLVVDVSDRKQAELELATAKAALERQIERALLLERITQKIRSSLEPQQIFQTAAIQIGNALRVNRCLIHSYIPEPKPQLPLVAEYGQPGYELALPITIPVVGNPHAELVLSRDQAVVSNNVYADPLLANAVSLCRQFGLKSMVSIRTSYQGEPNGVIGVHQCDNFRDWTQDEIELVKSVAGQVGIAIAQANLLEQQTRHSQELTAQNHALQKAKLEAEMANRAKSQFLSKMSHELRTPLNAILGFSQMMGRSPSLSPDQSEYIEIINRSGEHLLDLINDILSMAKIEAGQIALAENRFDLYRMLISLEEMFQFKANAKGLNLKFERASDIPQYIQTDEGKLRQVLINLISNAIKFTTHGNVTLRVMGREQQADTSEDRENTSTNSAALSTSKYRLFFQVEDTGPGIAANELSTIFDPFVQSQTGRQSLQGTGLGLTISQQFVRLMGGEIAVSSQLGQGTSFTFDILVRVADAAEERRITATQQVIGLAPNQPTYRILVVEDVRVNRRLLVKLLSLVGFEVREASNGQEGIAIWQDWKPHLIWMDMQMPVMDGYEATQYIKKAVAQKVNPNPTRETAAASASQ
ncbi:MAG TPA: response regulator, partial [Coleofasciculaceae cyanobacterium]